MAGQLAAIETRIERIEARLMARYKSDVKSQLLATIPGVGPIAAVSFALKVPDARVFRSRRHFAAWLGNTPHEHSTAGRQRLGKISRERDEGLRRLLVLGATAVIQQAKPGRTSPWLLQLLTRKPKKLAAVALANKIARIIWAMLESGELYRRPTPAQAARCATHSGACKDSSEMAIGSSEDRDNPGYPAVLRPHCGVWTRSAKSIWASGHPRRAQRPDI